jgi:hypothetical protein
VKFPGPAPPALKLGSPFVAGPEAPPAVAASTPGLPGGPPRATKPNNLKKAAVASTRKLKQLTIPAPAVRKLPSLADIRLPPKPQWVKNARNRASKHGGPAIVKATFPGLGPGWEEHNNNNWDDGEGPESNKVHEISTISGAPAAGPEAPVLAPVLPPALASVLPPALAPSASPRQPTAASTNKSYNNIKKRIGTIRQKFAEAKATINAFKARPKGKAQAKGGRRTRKLKSRR